MSAVPEDLTPMERARVAPEEGYALNRDNWDGRAQVHAASAHYDLEGWVADPGRVGAVVRRDLQILAPHLPEALRDGGDGIPRLDGLDVCHLQCHLGTDTLGLARRGARCTGVDLSPASLRVARDLAERAGADIRYVEANVMDAAGAVGATFDHVHTSIGTLCWLQDLATWGAQVAALLRPGGTVLLRDSHPMINVMGDTDASTMTPAYTYFPLPQGEGFTYADGSTYTDGDSAPISQPRNVEWPHPVGEILGALLGAGLTLEHVGEHQDLPWPAHPAMTPEGEDWVLPEPWRSQVPVALSVVARRPA
ncbi:class I SAM-dependent methyltransferase [Serinicoccus chungangensis]|uniref:class I SAM-dependent methyltransferase n=1 Tax=Serinicoccus chungangensis TaxID=767452 RepID=UPI0007A3B27E|nr:class I SAM-dependent methyltransferase [Serinicoccus chungangensis]